MTVKRISSARPSVVPISDRRVRRASAPKRTAKSSADTGLPFRDEAIRVAQSEVVSTPYIAILVPVLARPGHVAPLVESFVDNTPVDHARLYFVAQHSDRAQIDAIRAAGQEPIFVTDADRSWACKINRGYEKTTEPWMLLGADDIRFHAGWTSAIADLLVSHVGVIGTNDLGNSATMNGSHSTHPLVHRTYARVMGTADVRDRVLHDGYDHNYPDTELIATARARNMYIHRARCIIEHLHPFWGKSSPDATYARGQQHYEQDKRLFESRRRMFRWG